MKPIFTHDCDSCTFLGSAVIEGKEFDLYHCAYEPTVIARFSSEGADYASGLCFGESTLVRHLNGDARGNKALMVAYVMAMANGLDVKDRFGVTDLSVKEKIATYRKID